jgi:hypothetical protein
MVAIKHTFFLVTLLSFVGCTQGLKKTKTVQKEKKETHRYKAPDYNDLGYKIKEFTGEGCQAEMNDLVGLNFKNAEKRMHTILDSIAILYAGKNIFWSEEDRQLFFQTLERSQQQWKEYYETMVSLKFPPYEMDGSSSGMSMVFYKIELIDNRIRELNPWLMGVPQGECGSGTIRLLDYSMNDIKTNRR